MIRTLLPWKKKGEYWQSIESIPEPHEFAVTVSIIRDGTTETCDTYFAEHAHTHGEHGHSHGLVDESITRSKEGVVVVAWSLAVLVIASLLQTYVYFSTNSVSLLADLIHNFGDALTALPLGAAFLLRSRSAEKISGYFVVAIIFISAMKNFTITFCMIPVISKIFGEHNNIWPYTISGAGFIVINFCAVWTPSNQQRCS